MCKDIETFDKQGRERELAYFDNLIIDRIEADLKESMRMAVKRTITNRINNP